MFHLNIVDYPMIFVVAHKILETDQRLEDFKLHLAFPHVHLTICSSSDHPQTPT